MVRLSLPYFGTIFLIRSFSGLRAEFDFGDNFEHDGFKMLVCIYYTILCIIPIWYPALFGTSVCSTPEINKNSKIFFNISEIIS